MTVLDAALEYATMGLYVFPCNGKQPLVQWGSESTTDLEMVRKWWTTWPDAGIGVDCGKSGLVVIDLDIKSDADGPTNWQRRLNGHQIPHTFNVRTPSGGWHGWYRDLASRYRNSAGLIAPGVDVRGVGGYVLAPGSPGYRWYAEAPFTLDDIPPMPDGIIPAAASTGVGHWSKLDRSDLDPRDLAALEALEQLRGHGAYRSGDYIAVTRPGKTAGASATIGHIGPGIVRVFTSNWPKLREGVYDTDQLAAIAAGEQTPASKFDPFYLPRSALATLPRGEPLIDGILDRHSLFVVAGRDQSYKSFLVLGWLLSLATGHTWLGHTAEQIKVLYVVGEGAWGLNDRVSAWETAWRQKVDDNWFHVRRAPINLFRLTDAYHDLIQRVEEEQYGVVVFDTLQRMSSGADQNAARDAGMIITSLDRIRQITRTGAVGVVAHTDKADNDTRGSSAFEDDADIVWRVKRDPEDDLIRASLGKRKDGPAGLTVTLRPKLVPGTDSLVLERTEPWLPSDKPPAQAWAILRELAKPIFADGVSPTVLSAALGLSGKSSIYNALNWLMEKGYESKRSYGLSTLYTITSKGKSKLTELSMLPLTSGNVNESNESTTSPDHRPESVQMAGPSNRPSLDGSGLVDSLKFANWPENSLGDTA